MSKRMTSRDVDCPTCGAPKGERCRGSVTGASRGRQVDYHIGRRQVARALAPALESMSAVRAAWDQSGITHTKEPEGA